MKNVSVVKILDLTELFNQLSRLPYEIKQLKESTKEAKGNAYHKMTDMLNLKNYSVRKQVIEGKLFTKYLDGHTGEYITMLWSIKAYLKSTENSNS